MSLDGYVGLARLGSSGRALGLQELLPRVEVEVIFSWSRGPRPGTVQTADARAAPSLLRPLSRPTWSRLSRRRQKTPARTIAGQRGEPKSHSIRPSDAREPSCILGLGRQFSCPEHPARGRSLAHHSTSHQPYGI
eukprot:scaffold8066_cov157-Isochrysis_galbana.AAC.4